MESVADKLFVMCSNRFNQMKKMGVDNFVCLPLPVFLLEDKVSKELQEAFDYNYLNYKIEIVAPRFAGNPINILFVKK